MMLMLILPIVLIVALVASLPAWPHSRKWGYFPIGGVTVFILIIFILFFSGNLRVH